MGLEQVKDEIVRVSEQEAKALLQEGKKEAQEVETVSKARIDEMRRSSSEHLKTRLAQLERTELANARFEAKKLLSSARQTLIDEVFEEVRDDLAKSSPLKRKALFTKLLQQTELQMQIARLYADSKDKAYAGKYSCVSTPMLGGFIAENADGTVRVDCRYETLLESVRTHALKDVAETLFGKGA